MLLAGILLCNARDCNVHIAFAQLFEGQCPLIVTITTAEPRYFDIQEDY